MQEEMRTLNKIGIHFVIISIFIFLLLISSASAVVRTFKQGDTISVSQECTTDNGLCTNCTVSIRSPINNSIIVQNQAMAQTGTNFQYIFTGTPKLGTYSVEGSCTSSVTGEYVPWFYTFDITTNGNSKSLFTFILLIAISLVLLIIGMIIKNEYVGFIAGAGFIMGAVFSLIYGLGDVSDVYTRAMGYVVLGIGLIIEIAAGYEIVSGKSFISDED